MTKEDERELEWDGVVPPEPTGEDYKTALTLLFLNRVIADILEHGVADIRFKLMCDDCGMDNCDITDGVPGDCRLHSGENFRESGWYVGNFS